VGSANDAEDLLQETLLAAWRGLNQFQGRASIRAWLYGIATNRSLDALRTSRRRQEDQRMSQMPEPTRWSEPIWLEPYPDVLLEGIPDEAPGPDVPYETKEAIALAFIVGLQTSKTSVNSLLRRARAQPSNPACRPSDASARRSRTPSASATLSAASRRPSRTATSTA
jgi:RNA polymerase sigma factor (sigma-70 family)